MITDITSATREEQFIRLYKIAFPAVAAFIRKMNGTPDEAKDIFQDALVIYYEKKMRGDFSPQQTDGAYVTGIAKHLWYKKFKDKTHSVSLNKVLELKAEDKEPAVSADILKHIERSGKKCLELLKSFYYDRLNMKEIAESFGFSGERSATAQKYKCLEKVRTEMRERSLSREDFYA